MTLTGPSSRPHGSRPAHGAPARTRLPSASRRSPRVRSCSTHAISPWPNSSGATTTMPGRSRWKAPEWLGPARSPGHRHSPYAVSATEPTAANRSSTPPGHSRGLPRTPPSSRWTSSPTSSTRRVPRPTRSGRRPSEHQRSRYARILDLARVAHGESLTRGRLAIGHHRADVEL